MTHLNWIFVGWIAVFCVCESRASDRVALDPTESPNIVIILADDLGYGDLKSYSSTAKTKTPNLDRLAENGLRFTNAHSSAAVCTPTRYSLLTGRYSWRSRLKQGVLGGYSPPLIEAGRPTLANIAKDAGYRTACIGKWHLGWNWPLVESAKFGDEIQPGNEKQKEMLWKVDWKGRIDSGPTTNGFDYYFGISASLDMPPYVYVRNDSVVEVPTTEKTWVRKGPAAENFEAEDVLAKLGDEAVQFISESDAKNVPYLLYLPLTSPHTPIVPSKSFQGTGGGHPYLDFVAETDSVVGRILDAIQKTKRSENTLVIFTSDNGFAPYADLKQLQQLGHEPSAGLRGYKADLWEGGHRVPFIAYWPDKIQRNGKCDSTICLIDLFATVADLVGEKPPAGGEDSYSLVPFFTDPTKRDDNRPLITQSINGSLALHLGDWKVLKTPDSGGWSDPKPGKAPKQNGPVQLYQIRQDVGEKDDLALKNPEIAESLLAKLAQIVKEGRSKELD